MLILLPPSEDKATRVRGKALNPQDLSFPSLNPARQVVADALAQVSAQPGAAQTLKVSPNLVDDIARNTSLGSAPTLAASQLYTGVLYSALGYSGLDPAARRRANRRIVVMSALFGAVKMTDRLPPYRLSMGVNLPGVGPLASHWREPLKAALDETLGGGLIIDCRSSTYAAAWAPPAQLRERWVQVHVPGATHMAKHTRGLVTRSLVQSSIEPRTPQALAAMLSERYVATTQAPTRNNGAWVLSVNART